MMHNTLRTYITSSHLHHLIRYSYLLLVTLLVTHFFIYQKLPFEGGYNFPWFAYLVISGMATFICAGNWWVYQRYNLRSNKSFLKAVFSQLALNAGASALLYTLIYLLVNQLIFSNPWVAINFFKYMLICLVVSGSYVVLLTARELYANKRIESRAVGELLLRNGKRNVRVLFDEIDGFELKTGVIIARLKDGATVITQYSAMSKLVQLLPESDFFQVNRQHILHRKTIREVIRINNRKLQIDLRPSDYNLNNSYTVSRYRSAQFLKWFFQGNETNTGDDQIRRS